MISTTRAVTPRGARKPPCEALGTLSFGSQAGAELGDAGVRAASLDEEGLIGARGRCAPAQGKILASRSGASASDVHCRMGRLQIGLGNGETRSHEGSNRPRGAASSCSKCGTDVAENLRDSPTCGNHQGFPNVHGQNWHRDTARRLTRNAPWQTRGR